MSPSPFPRQQADARAGVFSVRPAPVAPPPDVDTLRRAVLDALRAEFNRDPAERLSRAPTGGLRRIIDQIEAGEPRLDLGAAAIEEWHAGDSLTRDLRRLASALADRRAPLS